MKEDVPYIDLFEFHSEHSTTRNFIGRGISKRDPDSVIDLIVTEKIQSSKWLIIPVLFHPLGSIFEVITLIYNTILVSGPQIPGTSEEKLLVASVFEDKAKVKNFVTNNASGLEPGTFSREFTVVFHPKVIISIQINSNTFGISAKLLTLSLVRHSKRVCEDGTRECIAKNVIFLDPI